MAWKELTLNLEHRHQHQDFLRTAETTIERIQKHTRVSDIDWKLGCFLAFVGQLEVFIDEFVCVEDVDSLCDVILFRSLEKLESYYICYTQSFEFENDVGEIHSHDLGRKPIGHWVEPFSMVYSETLTIWYSSSPASSLIWATLSARNNNHLIDSSLPVEAFDFYIATIDYELDVWDSDWTFCDIGGEDNLSIVAPLKDLILLLTS